MCWAACRTCSTSSKTRSRASDAPAFHDGIAEYLKLYYAGRDKLPPDETNGNTPLVSAHEVAWYAWTATHDPRLGDLIAKGEVKNMIDLCYQTLALAEIDRARYREQIQKNAERILSLAAAGRPVVDAVRPGAAGGGIPDRPRAVGAAGGRRAGDRIRRWRRRSSICCDRQQAFGGWMDPLQSFENFRTPFRETQMAVLALSAYFPPDGRAKGWNAPPLERLSGDPVEVLQQLDDVWDAPSPAVRKQIEAAAESTDALVRQAAVEALGRLGVRATTAAELLGDPSKLVQRTAAWALRQILQPASRRLRRASSSRRSASPDDRTRWGATRVFAAAFRRAGARGPRSRTALAKLVDDPVVSRSDAGGQRPVAALVLDPGCRDEGR